MSLWPCRLLIAAMNKSGVDISSPRSMRRAPRRPTSVYDSRSKSKRTRESRRSFALSRLRPPCRWAPMRTSAAAGAVTQRGSPEASRVFASSIAAARFLRRSMRNVVSKLATGSLPAASQLSGELRPRLAVTRFKEGEIAVHFLARKILPCPGEFQERASRSGEPPHDLAEALSLSLEGGQGGIGILGEGHRLHGHMCVDINTHI